MERANNPFIDIWVIRKKPDGQDVYRGLMEKLEIDEICAIGGVSKLGRAVKFFIPGLEERYMKISDIWVTTARPKKGIE